MENFAWIMVFYLVIGLIPTAVMAEEVLGYALAHTGNPEEGDYLLWQVASMDVEISSY